MAELTMFMTTDLSRPVPPVIFATDARGADEDSHGAYGMVAADADASRSAAQTKTVAFGW